MSEDDPPPENGDGDPHEVAESSDTEFLGCKDLSLPLPGVKSLDAQIQENGQRMMDAIHYLFRFNPAELEELQFRIVVAQIERNIRNRRFLNGSVR